MVVFLIGGNVMKMVERKLAIVLLDLIGSTAFVQKKGAVFSAKWFQYHDRLARNLCYKFHGREIDRSDGFLLSFDSVLDAVNFALHYQREIPRKTGLQTRIGVHWGVVVEVYQADKYVGAGAKRVELEGISKNIAARTMSVCSAGQVLLTQEAFTIVKSRTNRFTPKNTRYFCVGDYRFKGVRKAQRLYAVGETLSSLEPPKSSEKAKRLTPKKKVRVSFSKMTTREKLIWAYHKVLLIGLLWFIVLSYMTLSSPMMRDFLGLQWFAWLDLVNAKVNLFLERVIK